MTTTRIRLRCLESTISTWQANNLFNFGLLRRMTTVMIFFSITFTLVTIWVMANRAGRGGAQPLLVTREISGANDFHLETAEAKAKPTRNIKYESTTSSSISNDPGTGGSKEVLPLTTLVTHNSSSLSTSHPSATKLIFHPDTIGPALDTIFLFDGCPISNCRFFYSRNNISSISQADVVVFEHYSRFLALTQPPHIRQRQLWLLLSQESRAYHQNRWNKAVNDFNGTITYEPDSLPCSFPYGMTVPLDQPKDVPESFNYAAEKTKGAFAYVSNCKSFMYDRLGLMKHLSQYMDIDIFGKCTGRNPCPKDGVGDTLNCEAKLHSQYRFYLSFENSLCKNYITEKFWKTLRTEEYFIPVAIGGLSAAEYTRVAPPDSFIHVYNFTSIHQLGQHLRHLMSDDAAFNRYHHWRRTHTVPMYASKDIACNLCKVAHHPESLAPIQHRQFADEFNDPSNCRTHPG